MYVFCSILRRGKCNIPMKKKHEKNMNIISGPGQPKSLTGEHLRHPDYLLKYYIISETEFPINL